jgi:CRP-like cAMP-binding protein
VSLTGPQEKEIATLGPGEFFGEKALLSASSSEVTVTALDDVQLIVLDGPALQRLVDQAPQAAREIGAVLEARRDALRQARGGNGLAAGF